MNASRLLGHSQAESDMYSVLRGDPSPADGGWRWTNIVLPFQEESGFPANKRHPPNVGPILAQRRRRWTSFAGNGVLVFLYPLIAELITLTFSKLTFESHPLFKM